MIHGLNLKKKDIASETQDGKKRLESGCKITMEIA